MYSSSSTSQSDPLMAIHPLHSIGQSLFVFQKEFYNELYEFAFRVSSSSFRTYRTLDASQNHL